MYFIRFHRLMCVQVPQKVLIFTSSEKHFFPHWLISSCSPIQELQEENLPLRTEAKRVLSTSAFSLSIVSRSSALYTGLREADRGKGTASFTFFSCKHTCRNPFCEGFTSLALLQLCFGLPIQLNFICIPLPGHLSSFPGLCICFFVFGLTNSFLHSHANLWPSFYDIFLLISSSHSSWETSLKIYQFCSTSLILMAVSEGILMIKSLKS